MEEHPESQASAQRNWLEKNVESAHAAQRGWALRNADRKAAQVKLWKEQNRERVNATERERRRRRDPLTAAAIRRRYTLGQYGLTVDQFEAMLESQDFRCAICRSEEPNGKNWAVDHDHATGRVRGLLCGPCNSGLGQLQDDPSVLRSAIRYLKEPTVPDGEAANHPAPQDPAGRWEMWLAGHGGDEEAALGALLLAADRAGILDGTPVYRRPPGGPSFFEDLRSAHVNGDDAARDRLAQHCAEMTNSN